MYQLQRTLAIDINLWKWMTLLVISFFLLSSNWFLDSLWMITEIWHWTSYFFLLYSQQFLLGKYIAVVNWQEHWYVLISCNRYHLIYLDFYNWPIWNDEWKNTTPYCSVHSSANIFAVEDVLLLTRLNLRIKGFLFEFNQERLYLYSNKTKTQYFVNAL